ncbi:MAG: ABC transporter transmembrane domain-containing protein, partial [Anaerolineae bacterium]|nr:ABC transporter transmembrane domain-containing protein [Anaerolineae bacterium]
MFDRRLWGEARSRLGAAIATVLLHAALGIVTVVQAYLLSRIVAAVFLDGLPREQVSFSLRLLLALAVLRALVTTGAELAAGRIALDIKTSLRRRLFGHLLQLGPVRCSGERSGELSATLTSGVEALESYFSHYLPQLAIAVIVPFTILLTVFPVDPLTGIVMLLTAPLIPVFMILIGRFGAELTGRQWRALGQMSAHFLDVLQGLTTLKQLGRSQAQVENVARISDRYRRTTLAVLRVTFLSALALELVATLSVAVVAVEIALRLLRGGLTFADALFILVLAPEFYQPLRQLGLRFHAGMEGVTAAARIFALLDEEVPVASTTTQVPVPPVTLAFNSVHASYDETRQPALRGVSFRLDPGDHVALTGPSGAGKSTVLQLLLGFLTASSGE